MSWRAEIEEIHRRRKLAFAREREIEQELRQLASSFRTAEALDRGPHRSAGDAAVSLPIHRSAPAAAGHAAGAEGEVRRAAVAPSTFLIL
jgi:hypothetical protein